MVIGKTAQVLSCTINDIPLSQVTSCRNLGVTFNSDLNPSDHINDIVVRAHKRANLIHRCFTSREVTLLVRAFLTYVCPLVEHNCVIWSPSRKCDIIAIENVQRKFTSVFLDFLNTATAIVYRYWRYTVLSCVVCILI